MELFCMKCFHEFVDIDDGRLPWIHFNSQRLKIPIISYEALLLSKWTSYSCSHCQEQVVIRKRVWWCETSRGPRDCKSNMKQGFDKWQRLCTKCTKVRQNMQNFPACRGPYCTVAFFPQWKTRFEAFCPMESHPRRQFTTYRTTGIVL